MAVATIRDLRNHFPKVRDLVESEGEVIVTDKGKPRYKLTLYSPAGAGKAVRSKDYMARLNQHQPRPLSRNAAKSLGSDNRGDR